jgi:hypothetical protein
MQLAKNTRPRLQQTAGQRIPPPLWLFIPRLAPFPHAVLPTLLWPLCIGTHVLTPFDYCGLAHVRRSNAPGLLAPMLPAGSSLNLRIS